MYTVYALFNRNHDRIYIGQTKDLTERKLLHDTRTFKNGFTARFDGVWSIIYTEEVQSRQEALKREKQLKSFRGREFIKTHIPR